MKQLKKRKSGLILAGVLVFALMIAVFAPSLEASVCETALSKCIIDAGIAGLTGGLFVAVAYGSFCIAGYEWCLRYYIY